jgi:hypothetical protein
LRHHCDALIIQAKAGLRIEASPVGLHTIAIPSRDPLFDNFLEEPCKRVVIHIGTS